MASYLINCSNIRTGGSLQVADSVCRMLDRFQQHQFVVVLSSRLETTRTIISRYANLVVMEYDMTKGFLASCIGRDEFLDSLVDKYYIDAVLTLFGPPRWRPGRPHLCGFARPHIVFTESPFFRMMKKKDLIRDKLFYLSVSLLFRLNANSLWTENAIVSGRLRKIYKRKQIHVVTNYYNQVYDCQDLWKRDICLSPFDGITIISISAAYRHKNYPILSGICEYLEKTYPSFKYRFVLTQTENQCRYIPDKYRQHFVFLGQVDVSQCPYLYEQSDVMFMPTLLESFTATYPEAMRMEVPIITTDLEFAHGLCGNAACYYSAVDAKAAAEAVYKVGTDKVYAQQLVENGRKQLKLYDNYEQRAEKLVQILAGMTKDCY